MREELQKIKAAWILMKRNSTIIIKRRDNFAPQEVPAINKVS